MTRVIGANAFVPLSVKFTPCDDQIAGVFIAQYVPELHVKFTAVKTL
jgi:hypothetical protein